MANKQQNKDRIVDPKVDRIWEVMREKKLNIKKLEELSGVSYVHLNKVLNGIKPLTFPILERIANNGFNLPLEYFLDNDIANDLTPHEGHELMSDILKGIPQLFEWCENQDVSRLTEFFETDPTRPLIATGHGGKYAEAVYAALLYSTYQSLGRAVTCYSCNSLSDATITNSKVLLVSKGMANIDIDYIANRCIDLNPHYTCAVRTLGEKEDSKIVKKLDEKCDYSLKFDFKLEDGFISIRSVFVYTSLFYIAFTKDHDFTKKLELNPIPSENYTYEANGFASIPSLNKIKQFTVLYGSYAEPIAYNIESNIVESGIASCMISDYKNYTHGRFMTEANYIKHKYFPQTEAALICLVTPRERNIYRDLLDELPPHLPIITIQTDLLTPLATVDLLYKANMFVSELGEKYHHTNPNDPTLFNYVDKRRPKNYVDFKKDFKIYGALDYNAEKALVKKVNRNLKVKVKSLDELFIVRNEILAKEKERTEAAKENWKNAKPISWGDFGFRQTHVYDTQKQECWAFNSKDDVRDGISLKLGNMSNGYGVHLLGIDFPNSEVPYQLANFTNDKEAIKLQEEIVNPQNQWLTNGLKMKRKFIYNENNTDGYYKLRRDREFEGGKQQWCYEWMKFIVWLKVKQNEEFRNILLSIPKNAIIIEQAQKEGHTQWACWNEDLIQEKRIVITSAMIENGLGKTSKPVKDVFCAVNNVGQWVGENAMGQILTMAKLALNEGIEMPIDVDILNEARINWFGQILKFTKDDNGKVTVEAVSPRLRLIPTFGIMGAICGDVLGSVYELEKDKSKVKKVVNKKRLNLLKDMDFTDDTVLTVAVAKWLMEDKEHTKDTLIDLIKEYGKTHKYWTFSKGFKAWVKSDSREPYASGEDGCAMRVSPIGYYAKTLEECLELAKTSAIVTHNDEEGIRGAQAVAAAIFLYKNGKTKAEIKQFLNEKFPMYDLDRKVKDIRPSYKFTTNCDEVVPESIICFLEGNSYEETVRLAISLGGDADTMGAISGGIAAARMEIDEDYARLACERLHFDLKKVMTEFNARYMPKIDAEVAQDAIQEPLMPKLARNKVTVAKEKKTSQKVRKQAISQNDGQTVETNFELTEQNKASKKEMLSIKSGDLLDDLLKQ